MNLPNKLTVLRVVLVPVFLVFLLVSGIPYNYSFAFLVFTAASLTDLLDGNIARKRNLVTNFGKFLDPLADKILVTGALIAFVELRLASCIAVIIIVTRDFIVSAIRLIAVNNGRVVAANIWGKLKTVIQMVTIISVLLAMQLSISFGWFSTDLVIKCSNIAVWVLAAVTAISGWTYLAQNKDLISKDK
ncbi:MAG: CDP-diacylglycerol--glycerol-3-phosphate 3-phosphatidyltransferase [Oscillospiraceae bacterium]